MTRRGWHLTGIVQLDNGTLVISGETGLLVKSTDGGKTWQLLKAPWTGTFFGLTQLGPTGIILYGLRGHAFLVHDIGKVASLPPDTSLMFDFKKPPTMGPKPGAKKPSQSDKKPSQSDKKTSKKNEEAASKQSSRNYWKEIDDNNSILTIFGATTTEDGGYVLVGRNGVIWASNNHGASVTQLPNPREGSLSAVVPTPEGNLVIVGKKGAFLYKTSQ